MVDDSSRPSVLQQAIAVIFVLIALAVSVYLIAIGFIYLGAMCNYNLPVWLIVMGVVSILSLILQCVYFLLEDPSKGLFVAQVLLVIFIFAWLVVGSFWSFQSNANLCSYVPWFTSFVYLIVTWIIVGLTLCCNLGYYLLSICR